MSDFIRSDELKKMREEQENCGVCYHRTSYLGYCVKKGEKVGQWSGPCPLFRRAAHV